MKGESGRQDLMSLTRSTCFAKQNRFARVLCAPLNAGNKTADHLIFSVSSFLGPLFVNLFSSLVPEALFLWPCGEDFDREAKTKKEETPTWPSVSRWKTGFLVHTESSTNKQLTTARRQGGIGRALPARRSKTGGNREKQGILNVLLGVLPCEPGSACERKRMLGFRSRGSTGVRNSIREVSIICCSPVPVFDPGVPREQTLIHRQDMEY